jgi:hypothetical protein
VWGPAATLWDNGHRRAAVQAAASTLFDTEIPAKLERGQDTRGGADLVGQAFSIKPPDATAARLRLPGYDKVLKEKDWVNAHEGAMHLGQGCAQLIRNLSSHGLTEPNEQEALEMLGALSLLARKVADAVVDKAPTPAAQPRPAPPSLG